MLLEYMGGGFGNAILTDASGVILKTPLPP
jgi:hypothetical protein